MPPCGNIEKNKLFIENVVIVENVGYVLVGDNHKKFDLSR